MSAPTSPRRASRFKVGHNERRLTPPTVVLAVLLAAAGLTTTGFGARHDAVPAQRTTVAGLHTQAVDEHWPGQAQILADGHVSSDELSAAFADFRACVESYGLSLSGPSINRVDGWRLLADINYNGVSDQDTIDEANDCSRTRMSLVEIGYELTNAPRMDPTLMTWTRQCLTKRGLATTGTEGSVADLIAGDDTRTERVQTCLQAGAHALYPREPLAIAY